MRFKNTTAQMSIMAQDYYVILLIQCNTNEKKSQIKPNICTSSLFPLHLLASLPQQNAQCQVGFDSGYTG